MDRARLRGRQLTAAGLADTWESMGLTTAAGALRRFLSNSGKPNTVDVDAMLGNMPAFRTEAQAFTDATLRQAQASMPDGYHGPVAFVSDWAGVDITPSPVKNPDWFLTLGSCSSQISGIATPNGDGTYAVVAQVGVYDYYNFSPTAGDGQYGWLNDLHQHGWAQNYDNSGTSTTQASTWNPP